MAEAEFAALVKDKRLQVKVLLTGAEGAGKTTLSEVYRRKGKDKEKEKEKESEGGRKATFERVPTEIVLVDPAGEEAFLTLTSGLYRGVGVVLVCFDATDAESFEAVPDWIDEARRFGSANLPVVVSVVALKCRAENRAVKKNDAAALAKQEQCLYFEADAADYPAIEDAVHGSAREFVKRCIASEHAVTLKNACTIL